VNQTKKEMISVGLVDALPTTGQNNILTQDSMRLTQKSVVTGR